MRKIFAVTLTVLIMFGLLFAPTASAGTYDATAFDIAKLSASTADGKNETVYSLLGYDGSAGAIYVVNQLNGGYSDYGSYSEIVNLSTGSTPVVDGDKITFPDENVEGGLYYQGTMEGQLPLTFAIAYYLDGVKVCGESLGGASGHLKITLDCAQNTLCDESVRKGLMAQITMNLDLNLARNVSAGDATTVITGNTMSVAFTVLPDGEGSFAVEADVTNFEMDAITVTLLQGGLAGITDSIDEYEAGFDDMLTGADDMVDGTSELKDGVSTLAGGMGDLYRGLKSLKLYGCDMVTGMQTYADGLKQYTQGVSDLAAASDAVKSGLDTLAGNGGALAESLSQLSGSVSSMASNGDLLALAQSLASSDDPAVQALAQGTLQMLGGLDEVSDGLDEVSGGVDSYADGVQQAAAQYGDFNDGFAQLAAQGDGLSSGYNDILSGAEQYITGVGSSASGAYKIYDAINGLPDNIQELIDGQAEFRDGIASAKDELQSETEGLSASIAVSFASPEKNHPNSVQYVLRTPSIEKPEAQTETQDTQQEETFFTRLWDLFR